METLEAKKTKKGMSPKEVIEFVKESGVQVIDYKFMDIPGTLQHLTYHAYTLSEDKFENGIGFDGSSIRGFQSIDESDMLLFPDPETAVIDPCCKTQTLSMFCNIKDPIERKPYTRDPRYVAQKAEQHLIKTGIATQCFFGPEAEFFIFDGIRFDQNQHEGYYHIDSAQGAWNSGRDAKPNLGFKPRYKEGYFPTPPTDSLMEFRTQAMLRMRAIGVNI